MFEGSQLPARPPSGETSVVEPGQQLGKYEIIERIATGGMAEIFLARASGMLGFEKLVVIKRILPHLASRNDFIQMFLDEARIATTLNHPNVVQTHEVGVHGKSYFIVMEYLAGEDLRAIVRALQRRKERMPIEHALNIVIGIAAGLQYAHEKKDFDGKPLSIVHRDVTPQNVIVSYDGGVKLLDFGIAKASNRINETRSGSFKGKVPYMSPEQCRGEALDRRTDVFSLGILLYEMTLGRRLFKGDTDFQILKQIADGAIVKPRAVDPSFDPRLEAVVMRALEADPAKRFQSARELQQALEQLAHDQRLRLSPISLADFMTALFADHVGKWQAASADGDVGKLEAHLATRVAEREADLAEEDGPPHEPSESQLPLLPSDAEMARGQRRARGWLVALLLLTAAGAGAWQSRARLWPSPVLAAPTPTAPPILPPILMMPKSTIDPPVVPAAAVVQVTTTPSGATLILDGKTLPQRSPARLEGIAAGSAHLLSVRLAGHSGAAQRFMLDGGEEAVMEFELHRSGHASVKRLSARQPSGARPAGVAAVTASAPAVAPPAREGEGILVVASSPWCNVLVDGQARGTTPVNLKLKSGSHDVTLSNAEFHIQRTISVDVLANQTVRKKLDFAPE